ncbi:MAG: carbohydrate kinase, partial [Thermomicrobiaceae bacterium]|nr:carbohydrate kinase [Thermomicrobiaceae bacterium]
PLSNLGSGAIGPDLLGLTLGTTSALRLLWQAPALAPPPGLWLYRLDGERVVLGGALSEGGNLYAWARAALNLPADETRLQAGLAALPPDGHGLTWLPFLAGERSPGWALDARGVVDGLTLDTTPLEILRAGLEAVACRLALVAEMVEQAVPGARTVVASGAALRRNPVWLAIVTDALGRPVLAPDEPEAALRGAGLMALAGLASAAGEPFDLEGVARAALERATRLEPDPANHAAYRAATARQRDLYRRLLAPPA